MKTIQYAAIFLLIASLSGVNSWCASLFGKGGKSIRLCKETDLEDCEDFPNNDDCSEAKSDDYESAEAKNKGDICTVYADKKCEANGLAAQVGSPGLKKLPFTPKSFKCACDSASSYKKSGSCGGGGGLFGGKPEPKEMKIKLCEKEVKADKDIEKGNECKTFKSEDQECKDVKGDVKYKSGFADNGDGKSCELYEEKKCEGDSFVQVGDKENGARKLVKSPKSFKCHC